MSEQKNITFKDLRFCPKGKVFQRSEKQVLKEISGEFRGCELTAVMGPSGCGKSSLLNILSGFVRSDVYGSIKVNGKERNNSSFREQTTTYIMQETNLHLLLTVRESMTFAMKLKTGNAFSNDQQVAKIFTILETLKLHGHTETLVKNLSGGQQKRLSVALELVNDPSILFLDEPTTGLDSSSSTQCIKLLKKLAQEGKTIVCTIHTPSALLFEMFDHIYAMAEGNCIYQGSVKNLVPFLTSLELVCPETFNPADYLLEIATNDYGPQNDRLTKEIKNGRNKHFRKNQNLIRKQMTNKSYDFSSSFFHQFNQLMFRNFLILKKDSSPIVLRFAMNFIVGILVGLLYIGKGNDGAQIMNIFKYIFVSIFFLKYTSYYSLQTAFSLELPIVKREYFNGWYSSAAYYLALTITDIPFTIISTLIYIFLTYIMTNMPLEEIRILTFLTVGILTSFTAQGLGLLAGSMFKLKGTLTFAAVLLPVYGIFAGIFILVKDTGEFWHYIFEASFVKHALYGATIAVLGWNRPKFDCNSDYCHYRWPHKFLESIGIDEDLTKAISGLLIFLVGFRVLAYCIMNHRLKH